MEENVIKIWLREIKFLLEDKRRSKFMSNKMYKNYYWQLNMIKDK